MPPSSDSSKPMTSLGPASARADRRVTVPAAGVALVFEGVDDEVRFGLVVVFRGAAAGDQNKGQRQDPNQKGFAFHGRCS